MSFFSHNTKDNGFVEGSKKVTGMKYKTCLVNDIIADCIGFPIA